MDGSRISMDTVFTSEQIEAFKAASGYITSHKIGGGGGGPFASGSIRELRFRSGTKIDAILINGVQHGGNGGGLSDSVRLTLDKQLQDIGYAMQDGVLGSLTFYFTDGSKVSIGENRSETRVSTELGCDPADLLIIALGGWSGDYLDALDPVCVVGFSQSSVLDQNATAVIGAVPKGITRTEYVENIAKQAESYEHALTQTHSVTTSASVSGTYYVTASLETEYSYTWTSQTKIGKSIEDQLTNATTEKITPPDDAYAMFEICHGQIIAPGGDTSRSIFLPVGNVTSTYIPVTDATIDNVVGMYDLGGYCNMLPSSKVKDTLDATTGLNKIATA